MKPGDTNLKIVKFCWAIFVQRENSNVRHNKATTRIQRTVKQHQVIKNNDNNNYIIGADDVDCNNNNNNKTSPETVLEMGDR